MTDVSFAAVRPVRTAGIVYAVALAAACRGGSARKPAAARVAAPDTVPPPDTVNLYAAAGANALSSVAARARPLVYVPNSHDGSVTVIDPRRYRVVRTFPTGDLPQHVVPSYDLTTLWVANNRGNTLTPIDPATGREGPSVPVADPYNLYFTPDGRFAIVVAERRRRLDFRDAKTMALVQSVALGCMATGKGTHGIYPGRDGRLMYVTNRGWNTTAGGRHGPGSISVLDPETRRVVATWPVPGGGSPDMGNVSADGKELWVSGRYDEEVYVFDTATGQLTHRIKVGQEPHGLCVWPQPGRFSLGHTGNMR